MGEKDRVDIGVGSGSKKTKKGFKSDRYDRYQLHRKKQQGFNPKAKKETHAPVKEVRFDASDRKEFLLGFHKRKNERRATAFTDAKKKIKTENAKFRREQREEARRAYNAYAKVPILPDYSYQLPHQQLKEADDGSDPEEDEQLGSDFYSHEDSFGDVEGVSVKVEPLRRPTGTISNQFADLPQAVAETLKKLKSATKGPARTKSKKNTLKTLEKIRKIRKHCRKGHGKKAAKGKKKNRK